MSSSPDLLERLARLVVKDHVSLGGLSPADLQLALAVAHRLLPAGAPLSEREVNEALKAALAGAACWLGTDHVELRRWLVDAGWITRDGYGREYQVRGHDTLPVPLRSLARQMALLDLPAWVAAERRQKAQARADRRRQWEERQRSALTAALPEGA